jgi:hypothetical protein
MTNICQDPKKRGFPSTPALIMPGNPGPGASPHYKKSEELLRVLDAQSCAKDHISRERTRFLRRN